ncbi:hypothetical protein PROSTU_03190 [Providencia stuartii ATCC 25827]|uniref:Uncharacterized protein n=1 Tax=Providencia stuartii ATCC 25827 TaxID=471874 RepID=A0AA86YXM9_PROST|nr:hypothetical protein PROSTU_03190 [Providencia stuartii ATCC 25827]
MPRFITLLPHEHRSVLCEIEFSSLSKNQIYVIVMIFKCYLTF